MKRVRDEDKRLRENEITPQIATYGRVAIILRFVSELYDVGYAEGFSLMSLTLPDDLYESIITINSVYLGIGGGSKFRKASK